MASKKSKVLAIAFCAAVMAGIHVNPVLAAEIPVKDDGSVTIRYKDFDTTPGTGDVENARVTITNIARQSDLEDTQQAVEEAQRTANEVAGQIGGLKDDVSNQGQQIGDLEAEVGLQGGQIADLKDDVAGQGQQIGDLEVENDKQNSAIAGLDALLEEETTARQEADNEIKADLAQETNDREVADKIESTLREWGDEQLQENIEAEAEKREQADNQIKNDLKQETVDRIAGDNALNNAINKETVEREAADTLIKADLAQETNERIEADRKLDAAISDVNTRVDGLENRVDGLEDRIDKVGAMSAAIANLRTMGYDPAAPTEVAVGVGQYRDETGMALGLFHYPNRDFMLSLSVSTSGDEYMGGIGATWKFGRKSPEKVAEIKKAQAEADARRAEEQKLAKAEEMKKAAKEAKVQAQMERHAKMLAEQEAQAEA